MICGPFSKWVSSGTSCTYWHTLKYTIIYTTLVLDSTYSATPWLPKGMERAISSSMFLHFLVRDSDSAKLPAPARPWPRRFQNLCLAPGHQLKLLREAQAQWPPTEIRRNPGAICRDDEILLIFFWRMCCYEKCNFLAFHGISLIFFKHL